MEVSHIMGRPNLLLHLRKDMGVQCLSWISTAGLGQDPLEQVWRVTGGGVAGPLQQVQRMSSFSVKVGAFLAVTRRVRDPSHLQEGLGIGGT